MHRSTTAITALLAVLAFVPSVSGADTNQIPAWAFPQSATHTQVAPPPDFHRPGQNFDLPLGIFEGQSDIGGPFLPGSASYDPGKKEYIITSAGYNIWYTRDEFRYVWKKISGDVSLAADVTLVNSNKFGDCKLVLIIRQNLEDDSPEALATLHGGGMMALAYRPEKGVRVKDMEYGQMGSRGRNPSRPDSLVAITAKRLGLEKHGDEFALFVSLEGEPMHQFGPPVTVHFDGPFYAGIGFCSHQPDKTDTAVFSNVILENAAGKVR